MVKWLENYNNIQVYLMLILAHEPRSTYNTQRHVPTTWDHGANTLAIGPPCFVFL